MSHDNNPLARGVCSRLDEGLEEIPSKVANRLVNARSAAIAASRNSSRRKEDRFFPWKNLASWLETHTSASGKWVIPAMLVAGVAGFLGYQHYESLEEQNDFDVDVALLSSDLPLDAFLDRGFTTWVQTKSMIQGGTACGPEC